LKTIITDLNLDDSFYRALLAYIDLQ